MMVASANDPCPADIATEVCAIPPAAFSYSVVTFGNANIAAHSMYYGIAVGGTLTDGSPNESATVDKTKSYIKEKQGQCTFNFNSGVQYGDSCFADNLYERMNYIATHAQNSTNVVVYTSGGSSRPYTVDDFVPGGDGNDDGLTLAVFNTYDDIYIADAGGRQFGPTIIAPNAKVIVLNGAGYVDGAIYAKELDAQAGSLQLHGDTFTGTINCGSGTDPSTTDDKTGSTSGCGADPVPSGVSYGTYSGNPQCVSGGSSPPFGFDYGWKMNGCQGGSFTLDAISNGQVKGSCGIADKISVTVQCNSDKSATISWSGEGDSNLAIKMKGGNGGVLYDNTNNGGNFFAATNSGGNIADISHIEICVNCVGADCYKEPTNPAPTPAAPAPTPATPTGGYCVKYGNGCDGELAGTWCNKLQSNCEGNCNGNWCNPGNPAPTPAAPAPTPATPTGYCVTNGSGCGGQQAGGWCSKLQSNCEGNCNGEWCGVNVSPPTGSPTASPTGAPTASPTEAPTGSPTATPEASPVASPTTPPPAPDGPSPGDVATEHVFVQGDPHFKTFGGELYDYHGECDLVLLHNPDFGNGLGMDIHIRTKIEDFWSSVESAAIRIGDASLEIKADPSSDNWLWINGEAAPKQVGKNMLRADLGGFMVRYKEHGPNVREALVYLVTGKDSHKEFIVFKTFKSFVKIDVDWKDSSNYENSLGLLGSHDQNGKRLARDGKTFIQDYIEFGQEWQVLGSEPKLFHSYEGAVVGRKCVMPPAFKAAQKLRKRRLAESSLTEADADKACKHLADAEEIKSCVYDVLATQDLSMASVW
ncbi:expressed unknown protein [Seminavis robusta]|uniref:VWFD domain-containing protein n=1 Tax=Seminavis robusta TaxID=568900 RepID=A0A9N8H891_9STRA|nr:expressed unknown protein [Seminavis robusta]|eukprot:Sro231_g093650.1 n/a (812) ;mRNA; r:57683-60297